MRQRTVLITLSMLIVLCVAVPIAATMLRPAPPTEAQLVGTWVAADASITLREDGTALLNGVTAAESVTSGAGSWTLREDSSEGWIVLLSRGDLKLRFYVDQQLVRTSLIRHTCDPDAPECSIAFYAAD